MIQPLTMVELVDRLGQAERVQVASYCRMVELEDEAELAHCASIYDAPLSETAARLRPINEEWRAMHEMWREAKSLVATLSAQLDRFVR